jgi:hypothetical protein
VVRKGECNPESGGGYREFHFNDSLLGYLPIRAGRNLPCQTISNSAAKQALNQIE